MTMPVRSREDNRKAQLIRQPGKVRSLSREEIAKQYPQAKVAKDSRLTTSYRGPCDKGPDQVYIYGLADPRDHEIRYVGKTSLELGARLDWHIKEPTNRGMAEWLGTLWLCGIRPEIAVLEVCHVTSWEKSERSWIARLRKVGRMLNIEDGGESCHHRAGPNEFGTGKQTAHRWNDRDDLQVRAREGGRR
jgi:hypothetical protein